MQSYLWSDLSLRARQAAWIRYADEAQMTLSSTLEAFTDDGTAIAYPIDMIRENIMPRLEWRYNEHGERVA